MGRLEEYHGWPDSNIRGLGVLAGSARIAVVRGAASGTDTAQIERYRLGELLLRSARSTTANITEGHGRFHFLDNSKFCSNARGSCTETIDHLITARDECLAPDALLIEGRAKVEVTLKLLNGYIRHLQRADPARNRQPFNP